MQVHAFADGYVALRLDVLAEVFCRVPTAAAYLAGPEHRFQFLNAEYHWLVADRDVIGKPVAEALSGLTTDSHVEALDRVVATGEAVSATQPWMRRNGTRDDQLYVDFRFDPVLDDADQVAGVLVHADVSTALPGTESLPSSTVGERAAEERYRTLFETMLHGVVYQSADGAIIAVNPAACEILGADPEALIGLRSEDPSWEAVHEDGSPFPGDDHPAMTALRTGTVVRDVVMGVKNGRTGEQRWIEVTAVPDERDETGRPRRVYTMFTDVTEQRRTAAALLEWDRFLARLRDTNVLGLVLTEGQQLVDANDAFLGMVRHDKEDLAAGLLDWRALTPPEWRARDDGCLDELRRSGACRPYEKELVDASGNRVPVLVGAAVVDPQSLRSVTVVVDLSERVRAEKERATLVASAQQARAEARSAEDRLGFLLGAGALVAATRDRDELLQQVTRLVVPGLADCAAVFVPDGDRGLRLVTGEQAVVPDVDAFRDLRETPRMPEASGVVLETYRSGRSRLVDDVGSRLATSDLDPVIADLLARLSVSSAILTPLTAGERRLGLLGLGRTGSRPAFAASDVAVVEELGQRVAVGLANADAFALEHDIAEALQRSVLPEGLPDVPGVDLAVRYLPATEGVGVGGDWYDAFPLSERLLGLVIGDVVGHDLGSASAMNQIRNLVRAYAVDRPDPGSVLARTNAALARLLPDSLATVFYAVLDHATGELVHANAGHPPPLLATRAGAVFLDEPAGLVLGVDGNATFSTGRAQLAPTCSLLLYSDGLVEDRTRSIDDGLAALARLFDGVETASAEEACARAEGALLPATSRADDVCLLAAVCTEALPHG